MTRRRALSGPIAAAIAAIPDKALDCRRRRQHRWGPHSARFDRRENRWSETEECERCETLRTSHISADGYQLDAWTYRYPDGYLVAGGLPDDARAALRLESLRRRTE